MTTVTAPNLSETSADLRALYRAAEARAARLRVLAEAGQALALASADTLDDVTADLAREAAHLAGFLSGRLAGPESDGDCSEDGLVLPLSAPGSDGETLAVLVLEHRRGDPAREDLETLALLCQLIGGSLAARTREAQLASLLAELLRSQETERSRIAHELHDGLAQSVAALMRRLELATDGDATDLIKARDQAQALVSELRRVIAGMRPLVLDDLGLEPALEQLAQEARERGLEVVLDIKVPQATRPDAAIETALFRIVQEALNNACFHGGAGTRAVVELRFGEQGCTLGVRDNGAGFVSSSPRSPGAASGFGLAYMRKRVELLNGRLSIVSAPGAGCAIQAELPLS